MSPARAAGQGKARAKPLVIAHRGASGQRPENTLEAYALALEQGADMIEIDLHRSRDAAIVVAHDDALPGAGPISDATLAELRAAAPDLLTLDEVLDAHGAAIPWNLELKVGPRGPYPGLEEATLAALAASGLGRDVLFSSFDVHVLERLRALDGEARLGVLVGRLTRGWRERCAALGAEAVHFWKGRAGRAAIHEAHAAGLRVYVYTVDAPAEMQTLLAAGADGLFTNWPARLRALVDAR